MTIDRDDYLTFGTMSRRVIAWAIDMAMVALLVAVLWGSLAVLGLPTLGATWALLPAVSAVPFCYQLFSLLGSGSATPGQRALGLLVRRDDDLGKPLPAQAAICVILFYATLATSGLLLIVALFTTRHRTLHDIFSGLVVVRRKAYETLTPGPGAWNMYHSSAAPRA